MNEWISGIWKVIVTLGFSSVQFNAESAVLKWCVQSSSQICATENVYIFVNKIMTFSSKNSNKRSAETMEKNTVQC